MNRKGFVTSGIALFTMLTSLAFLAVCYSNVASYNLQIKTLKPNIETFIKQRTAQERVYGVFQNNFMRDEPIVFPDNDISIEIKEISETNLRRVLTLTPTWKEGETVKKLPAYTIAVERLNDSINQPIAITILETGIY